MEANTEGGRENSAASAPTNKDKDNYNNTNREIDQEHLAYLLHESAKLVEQGEFGSILYEALQDFRAYYKQKYPKSAKKKKAREKKSRSPIKTSIASGDKTASASSAILEDLKESEENTDKQAGSKSELDGAPTLEDTERVEDTEHSIDPSALSTSDNLNAEAHLNHDSSEHPEPSSTNLNDITTQSSPEEASMVNDTEPSISASDPSNNVDGSPEPSTSPHVESEPTDPVQPTPHVESAPTDPVQPTPIKSSAAPVETPEDLPSYYNTPTSNHNRSSFISPSTSNRGTVFGKKFKLGATLQNVKKGAMNVKKVAKNVTEKIHENIDKHHHHHNKTSYNTREELEFFAETGVEKAQSSGRRTWAGAEGSEEFSGNFDVKSRVTPGVAGASESGSPASELEPNAEDCSNDEVNNHYSNDNHGRPVSDRNLDRPTSDPSIGRPSCDRYLTNQGVQSRFGSNLHDQQKQQSSDDSHDSVGDRIRANSSAEFDDADPIMEAGIRPKFHRPDNTSSPLIVSGWIEQYRRSKMRYVWKEVLVSLVEGRKPGEVTTLWIQREISQQSTGLKELEALHRIPLKILEDVSFTENTTDNQFRLKVYHGAEDFVFRCDEAPNDSLRWVQILKKYKKLSENTIVDNDVNKASQDLSFAYKQSEQQQQQPPSTKGMAIRDLRAICHGAGVNTAGMERAELEAAADEVQRQGTYFNQRGVATGPNTAPPYSQQYTPQKEQQQPQSYNNQANNDPSQSRTTPLVESENAPTQQDQQQQQQPKQRLGIKELRAICHGAGISTAGMERRELEAAAREVQSRGTYFPAPVANQAANEEGTRAHQEELRRQQQKQQQEELKRRQEATERHRREVEEAQRRAAVADQEARRRAEEEEARRRAFEEEQRRRAAEEEARRRALEEEQRRRAVEDEARRRAAAEEQLQRQREAQAAQVQYAQQQAAWQQHQQAEEQRRRAAEQQAAAERRRRDEALRKEQEWSRSAAGAHHHQQQQQPHHYHQQQQRHQGYSQQQWQQQQQQQQHYHHQQQQQQHYQQHQQNHTPSRPQQRHHQPPRNQTPPPPPPQQQQKQHSGTDNKYAKMANQSDDDGQAAITKIKHSILIQWALQPPQLQMLRPIAALVTTIHTVFPPALGVSAHEYFKKWKPITREDVAGVNGLPEEAKLKKAVRKIRFFLHPDKLPHDLDEEQKFMVKMLWDVTSDAWEEYQKHKEELDWVN